MKDKMVSTTCCRWNPRPTKSTHRYGTVESIRVSPGSPRLSPGKFHDQAVSDTLSLARQSHSDSGVFDQPFRTKKLNWTADHRIEIKAGSCQVLMSIDSR